tara:strand:- start:286 stop:540 length:255 start_codon:yes stop_codon:yes gene_type:complete
MKKKLIFFIIFLHGFNNALNSAESDCNNFKKFSLNYMKCKSNLIKNKTITAGENFVKDTKDYQKKEWSEEKSKVDDVKKKVLGQ